MTNNAEQEFLQLINQNQGIVRKVCHLYGRNDTDKEDLYQEIVIQHMDVQDCFKHSHQQLTKANKKSSAQFS
jgi:DNA-directed RNA polymerase specialized sigma24 family protein